MKLASLRNLLLTLALGMASQTGSAAVITNGCTLDPNVACSLAELVNDPNAFIQIDGARFRNFAQLEIGDADLSRIRVEAIDSPGGANAPGSTVGLRFLPFDGLENLLAGESADDFSLFREITYDVSVLSGLPIGASTLTARFGTMRFAGGFSLEGGVRKTIDRPGLESVRLAALCSQFPATCQNRNAFDDESFGPVTFLSVTDDLFITHEASSLPADILEIESFSQTFFRTVPEPGALLLLGIGLTGLVASRRSGKTSA